MTMTKPNLVNTKQASVYVGLSPITLSRMRREHVGPRFLRLGKRVYYRLEDLNSWLDSATQDTSPAKEVC